MRKHQRKHRKARYDAYSDMRLAARLERMRVTLPVVAAIRMTVPPIFIGSRRESIVLSITAILRTWQKSKFQREGSVRNGVRSSLCLVGEPWQRADDEAASLVAAGLARIRAMRPSWQEGQWHYTDSLDFCSWCHRPIDDEDRTSGQRFCCVTCARAALEHRVYETRAAADAIGQSAQVLIARKLRPAVECKACGKRFHPRNRGAQYCSPKCSRSAKGDLLANRHCLFCGALYHPRDNSMTCCSKSCATRHADRMRQESTPERQCLLCPRTFRPRKPNQIYCSAKCSHKARSAAYRHRQKSLLWVFDQMFG